ncbi:hypothetical protein NY588_04940 [Curtobacterium flaccumfaciens pv. beticola]|uniref:Uncharacterized protein n=1 Tax=Curtobacterium citreum TaxID=2036 RepID=A0A850DX17_9MICO|nr:MULTISPECIES: hypothetical protein [Curtobacterium]MCS5486480.1 hypothetical protein [Curtobacterium flaccumfaciens pv. basellae]MDK8171464.1 hypothetical protein [Curtobacterium citreum]NUU29329.1 hypothetical protein [Curtobacterium albidum]
MALNVEKRQAAIGFDSPFVPVDLLGRTLVLPGRTFGDVSLAIHNHEEGTAACD